MTLSKKIIDNVFFFLVSSIVVVRLTIWKYYNSSEAFEKSDLSNIILSCVIFFIGLLFILHKFLTRESVLKSGFDLYPLSYLAVCFISIFYSVEQNLSLKHFCFLLAMVIYFYMVVNILTSKKRLNVFVRFLIVCGFITALWGLKDYVYLINRAPIPEGFKITEANKSLVYVLNNKRVTSFLGWPNVLAGFLMLFIPLSAAFIFITKRVLFKVFFLFSTITMLSAMYLTFSIAGWISFILSGLLGLIVLFFVIRKIKINKIQKYILVGLIIIGCLAFYSVAQKRNIFHGSGSINERKQYIRCALLMIKERPFTGYGYYTYQVANRPFILSKEGYSAFAHSSYLQIWSETGIASLIIVLIFIFQIFRKGVKCLNKEQEDNTLKFILMGLLWGMLGFLIHNTVSFTMIKPNISFYWWVVLAVCCVVIKDCERPVKEQRRIEPGKYEQSGLMILGCFFIIVMLGLARMYKGEKSYYEGIRAFKKGDYALTLQKFNDAVAMNPYDGRFHASVGQIYYHYSVKEKTRKYLSVAIEKTNMAIEKMPLVYQNHYTMGQLMQLKGDVNLAKWHYNKAKSLAPYKFNMTKANP